MFEVPPPWKVTNQYLTYKVSVLPKVSLSLRKPLLGYPTKKLTLFEWLSNQRLENMLRLPPQKECSLTIHLTGVIILATRWIHYFFGEIPQDPSRFVLVWNPPSGEVHHPWKHRGITFGKKYTERHVTSKHQWLNGGFLNPNIPNTFINSKEILPQIQTNKISYQNPTWIRPVFSLKPTFKALKNPTKTSRFHFPNLHQDHGNVWPQMRQQKSQVSRASTKLHGLVRWMGWWGNPVLGFRRLKVLKVGRVSVGVVATKAFLQPKKHQQQKTHLKLWVFFAETFRLCLYLFLVKAIIRFLGVLELLTFTLWENLLLEYPMDFLFKLYP